MTLRMIVRRKPKEIEVERWDGPSPFLINRHHRLGAAPLWVEPGDYIAKAGDDDWYPLAAAKLETDFEWVRYLETPEP